MGTDRRTDMTFPVWVHFLHFVQTTYTCWLRDEPGDGRQMVCLERSPYRTNFRAVWDRPLAELLIRLAPAVSSLTPGAFPCH